jgi:hypothetical protein
VGKSSSAKKVARLAQKGKGRQVRFQGGTLFPAVVLIVGVLGALLIFYARGTRPDHNSPPTTNDHWHVAYGVYVCDAWLDPLQGTLEEQGTAGYQKYVSSGVHSHGDGVIHWHPFTSKATGTNAKLGLFLDNYGISLSKDELSFPADQNGGATYNVDDFTCTVDGQAKDVVIKVMVFDPYNSTENAKTYITDFDSIPIKDSTSISIIVAPEGTNPGFPPSATNLPELGAADTGGASQATTPAGGTATIAPTPDASTVPGDTTDAGSTAAPTETTSPAATEAPATTAAPTTTG